MHTGVVLYLTTIKNEYSETNYFNQSFSSTFLKLIASISIKHGIFFQYCNFFTCLVLKQLMYDGVVSNCLRLKIKTYKPI